jgi:PAS domain S-box-containing protein
VYPNDVPLLRKMMQQYRQPGQLAPLEHRVLTPAGQLKWVEVIASLEVQPNGDLVWDGVSIDITERKQAEADLREGETRFRKLAESLPGVIFRYVWYPDGTEMFTYLSPRCTDIYEIEPSFILQDPNTIWSIVHPDDLMALQDAYAVSALTLEVCSLEHRIITTSGRIKWLQIVARPERQPNQDIVWDGLAIETTERKQAEAQLRASLQEKEALLQEIHHRVKNNLQIISSLLHLQADRITDVQLRQALEDCWNRIDSMSLVHESLYRSGNFAGVDFAHYIQSLAANLFNIYNTHIHPVTFNANVDPDIKFNLNQAIPYGLIINELITNALKHGLSNCQQQSEIFVTLARQPNHFVRLEVGNRGVSLPPDFAIDTSASMGLKLVMNLVDQLEGSLTCDRGDPTIFRIVFPLADNTCTSDSQSRGGVCKG